MTSNHLSQPGIYEVVNTISGSRYVGSAVCIGQRWKSHRSALRNQKKAPPKLQRAWDKYGEAAFDFRVLEFCGYAVKRRIGLGRSLEEALLTPKRTR